VRGIYVSALRKGRDGKRKLGYRSAERPGEDAQLAKRLEKHQRMSTEGDLSGENGELDVIQCEGNRQSRISCE